MRSLLATALVLMLAACAGAQRSPSIASISVQELDGRSATLGALRGRPGVVYLLTTGCDACLADLAKLRSLHERYGERGLRVVAVVLDPTGATVARPFAESLALPFPVVVAGEALRDGKTALGPVTGVPRVLVVGRDAQVRADLDGVVAYDELARQVEAVLAEGG